MSEYMVKYMQKQFYKGLTNKNELQSNMALEWFNNCGVFIEDENNLLCNECPCDCQGCKDIISKKDYLIDLAYNEDCFNSGDLE